MITGRGAGLVEQRIHAGFVRAAQGGGELRAGTDFDAGRGGEGVGAAAFAGEGEFREVDIVGRSRAVDEARAGDDQDTGGPVVGGGGEGGDGNIADGQRVGGVAGVPRSHGGVEVVRRRQVVSGAAAGRDAVLVEDQVHGRLISGIEVDGELGRRVDLHPGTGQGVGASPFAGERQFGRVDVRPAGIGDKIVAGDGQRAGGGVVGGGGEGGRLVVDRSMGGIGGRGGITGVVGGRNRDIAVGGVDIAGHEGIAGGPGAGGIGRGHGRAAAELAEVDGHAANGVGVVVAAGRVVPAGGDGIADAVGTAGTRAGGGEADIGVGDGGRDGVDGDGEPGRSRGGITRDIGLLGGDGVATGGQCRRGDAPVAAAVGGSAADGGGAVVEGDRGPGLGGAGEGRRRDLGDVVGIGTAAVAAGGEGRFARGGRGGGVDGDGEAGRGRGGIAGDIGLLGGDGVATRGQCRRGDAPVAAAVGGSAADGGGPVVKSHRGPGLGGAGEGRRGDVGDVVGIGTAAVAAGGEGRFARGGRGGGVDGDGEAGRSPGGIAGDIGLLGGDGVAAVGQCRRRGDAPVAAAVGGSAADGGGAVIEGDRGPGLGGAGEGRSGDVGDVVGIGTAAVAAGGEAGDDRGIGRPVDSDAEGTAVGTRQSVRGYEGIDIVSAVGDGTGVHTGDGPGAVIDGGGGRGIGARVVAVVAVLVEEHPHRAGGVTGGAGAAEVQAGGLGDIVAVRTAGVADGGENRRAGCVRCHVDGDGSGGGVRAIADLNGEGVGAGITRGRGIGQSAAGRDVGGTGTRGGGDDAQCAVAGRGGLRPGFGLAGVRVADMDQAGEAGGPAVLDDGEGGIRADEGGSGVEGMGIRYVEVIHRKIVKRPATALF